MGLINLINNQGNRSDNDAPQDQCCFVVFMTFSGGLGLKCGLVSRLGCRGGGVMFYFFFVYRILLTVAGQMRSWVSTTSDAPISVLPWTAGGVSCF